MGLLSRVFNRGGAVAAAKAAHQRELEKLYVLDQMSRIAYDADWYKANGKTPDYPKSFLRPDFSVDPEKFLERVRGYSSSDLPAAQKAVERWNAGEVLSQKQIADLAAQHRPAIDSAAKALRDAEKGPLDNPYAAGFATGAGVPTPMGDYNHDGQNNLGDVLTPEMLRDLLVKGTIGAAGFKLGGF